MKELECSPSKGLKHYPGLLSYVGIAVNVANERLQYTSEEAFVYEFESFVKNEVSQVQKWCVRKQ